MTKSDESMYVPDSAHIPFFVPPDINGGTTTVVPVSVKIEEQPSDVSDITAPVSVVSDASVPTVPTVKPKPSRHARFKEPPAPSTHSMRLRDRPANKVDLIN